MLLRPRPILMLLVLLAAPLLAGCASSPAPTSGTPSATPSATPGATPSATPTTAPVITARAITAGTEAKYPPFEDLVNGQIIGFDIDVMNEVAKRAKLTVKFQNAAFDDIIPSIQSGQFDIGVSAFTITDKRKESVDFTIPYYDNELMVATLASNTNVKTESDLKPATVKVCTQTGTTSEDYLRGKGYDNNSMTLLADFPTCGETLKRGDVQAIIIDRAAVRDLIDKSNGQFRSAFTVPVDEHFGIAVSKQKTDLLTLINTAIQSMKADGTLKTLQEKWKV